MGKHSSLNQIVASDRESAEGFVRMIVESFRDASNPSVEIAVEEIMMTFDDALQDQERMNWLEAHPVGDGETSRAYISYNLNWTIVNRVAGYVHTSVRNMLDAARTKHSDQGARNDG